MVDTQGNGWYIRHIRSVAAYAQQNPKLVKAGICNFFQENLAEYEKRWRIKVRQFQIPIFLENTDAMWQIRFDDVIANALTLGPLRDMDNIVYPVCKLCRDHEKAGFIEGIRLGVLLAQEVVP